jgi:hypothetical protein
VSDARPTSDRVNPAPAETFTLTDEQRMLLDIRDTLYEGSWVDFERDLEARMNAAPHVFETVPASPEMRVTIRGHLRLIEEMRSWEAKHNQVLRGRTDS